MYKLWQVLVAAATAIGIGLVGTSVVYGGPSNDATTPLPQAAVNRAPVEAGQSLEARTPTKHGAFGVLRYRNKGGQQCMAAGRVNGTVIGAGAGTRFKQVPLEKVGQCNLHLDPAAVTVMHSREETTIYGVTADDVTGVSVASGDTTLNAAPTADHAFIVNTPKSLSGEVVLTATLDDGTKQSLKVADLPDFDEINALAKRNEPAPVAAWTDPTP